MKTSQLLLATLREAPAEAEIISHKLMLRAGMVRQLTRGIYTWLPLGLRVLRKIESIVRDEMDASGAQEVLMPAIQPAELWRESGRWEQYGPELLRLTDRHDREFCFGPTHEEIITDLVRREINSYKQLPANFYQIQTKFRDEVRPRFGIMRAREFLMKDAYSFHLTRASMERTYEDMHRAYSNIFTRLGLKFRAVMADSGNIGGNCSHEFHVLAQSGEDQIVFTEDGDYAANLEQAEAMKPTAKMPIATATMATISTPGQHSIAEVSEFLRVQPQHCLKTLIVEAENGGLIALVLRGDHELNQIKAERLPGVKAPLAFAEESAIRQAIGCGTGTIGPVGLSIPMYVDHCAAVLTDFVCGANQDDIHLTGVNWERDAPVPESVDIRNVCEGDMAIDGSGPLRFARGIEVGHIFQLGDKYSASLDTTCLDGQGKAVTLLMGCYGIGVSRIVAAAIEQNHDDKGICWSAAIAPFSLALVPINMHKSQRLREAVTQLYGKFLAAGIDVILDDRKERPGVMFADMELIGIPHRIVFSERGLDSGMLEYKSRRNDTNQDIPLASAVEAIQQLTDNEN